MVWKPSPEIALRTSWRSSCLSSRRTSSHWAVASVKPVLEMRATIAILLAAVHDADNDPACNLNQSFRYAWKTEARPGASAAVLSDPQAPSPAIVPDQIGAYQFSVVVTDSTGLSSDPKYVTFTTMLERECGSVALRQAARTVGSPQIRNAATIGGNVATSSPAGDALPVLAALEAKVHLRSTRGSRVVRFGDFMVGPKKNVRARAELVTAVEWDDAGPAQVFMKVGTRNAMVIAVAGLALVADRVRRRVGIGLGSCGPTILRAPDAESFAAGLFDEAGWRKVAAAARPIDDVRGTAAYRRHVLAVLGARALARVARMREIA